MRTRRRLEQLTLLALAALHFAPPLMAAGPQAQPKNAATAIDLVLIVDTSKSMVGKGGGTNIFAEVKATCKQLVKELSLGDSVTLIPYGTDVRPHPTVTLLTETERMRLFTFIDSLAANDDWTYTARALQVGLAEAARLEEAQPGRHRVIAILTDGLNDPPPAAKGKGPTLAEVARPYAGKPWYVFQVQLGPTVDSQLSEALGLFPHGRTIHDPRGTRLSDLPRQLQPPPGRMLAWSAKPDQLEIVLKALQKPISKTTEIEIPPDLDGAWIEAKIVSDNLPDALELNLSRQLSPGKVTLTLSGAVHRPLPNATYPARIVVSLWPSVAAYSAAPLEIPVKVQTRVIRTSWPLWVGALATLFISATLLSKARKARRLFGSLELWLTADPKQRARFEDLSQFGTKATLGEEPIRLPAARMTVGHLTTRVVDGVRHVVLVAKPGVKIMLQGRTYGELVLYDGDQLQIQTQEAEWGVWYRGEVPVRPQR